jgi:hypothetical protein
VREGDDNLVGDRVKGLFAYATGWLVFSDRLC